MRLKLKKREGDGEAYALLKLEHEKDIGDIERELYSLDKNKQEYGIHPELYVYVAKTSSSDIHTDLKKHADWDYILKAILPGATNEETANELSHATNQLYRGLNKDHDNEELGNVSGKNYHETIHIKHDTVHYEHDGRHHHLRKKQKVYRGSEK